eukprot:XP_017451215.1 PREDICTED: zinc finger protein 426-like 2 isoform X3 [Rattus norvegicus]
MLSELPSARSPSAEASLAAFQIPFPAQNPATGHRPAAAASTAQPSDCGARELCVRTQTPFLKKRERYTFRTGSMSTASKTSSSPSGTQYPAGLLRVGPLIWLRHCQKIIPGFP